MIARPALATVVLLLAGAPALAQGEACGAFPVGSERYACTCSAGPHARPVWGSGPYTADSDVCTAAQHAGVLPPEGGQVVALGITPPPSYEGTVANGVTTAAWGAYDAAFSFGSDRDAAGLPICGSLLPLAEFSCTCPAGRQTGAVWGTGPYTADSDICSAAIHAGVIGAEGGEVLVRRTAGQESYGGTTANGVTSNPWGAFGASFVFGPKG